MGSRCLSVLLNFMKDSCRIKTSNSFCYSLVGVEVDDQIFVRFRTYILVYLLLCIFCDFVFVIMESLLWPHWCRGG